MSRQEKKTISNIDTDKYDRSHNLKISILNFLKKMADIIREVVTTVKQYEDGGPSSSLQQPRNSRNSYDIKQSLFFKGLKERFTSCKISFPADNEFQEIIKDTFNAGLHPDEEPLCIIQPERIVDVIPILALAHSDKIPVAIRASGTSWWCNSLHGGSVLLNLSNLKHILPNTRESYVIIEPGVTIAELLQVLKYFDFVVPTGSDLNASVIGQALHGGFGPLSRLFGLLCMNILSVDLVLPDGEFIPNISSKDPLYRDIMFGIRGAGSCYGLVISMKLKVHRLPNRKPHAGFIRYPAKALKPAFSAWKMFVGTKFHDRFMATTFFIQSNEVIIFLMHFTDFQIQAKLFELLNVELGAPSYQNWESMEYEDILKSINRYYEVQSTRQLSTSHPFQYFELKEDVACWIHDEVLRGSTAVDQLMFCFECWGASTKLKEFEFRNEFSCLDESHDWDVVLCCRIGWDDAKKDLENKYLMEAVLSHSLATTSPKPKIDFPCYESYPTSRDPKLKFLEEEKLKIQDTTWYPVVALLKVKSLGK